MSRTVCAGALARAQIDIYDPVDSFTRATGVIPSGITLELFVNGILTVWPILDGASIADSSISAGNVYFNEIGGSPGFYNIRFYPDSVGFWRFVMKPVLTSIEIIQEYDVVPASSGNSTGALNATFVKP